MTAYSPVPGLDRRRCEDRVRPSLIYLTLAPFTDHLSFAASFTYALRNLALKRPLLFHTIEVSVFSPLLLSRPDRPEEPPSTSKK